MRAISGRSPPGIRTRDRAEVPLSGPWKPTKVQVAAADNKTVDDLIGPGLKALFCGINPSLYSAAVGHHFARPGNRFWPTLHSAGLTPRLLSPFEDRSLLDLGYGITNLVARATVAADELSAGELVAGGRILEEKVRGHRPAFVAFLGITAYRAAFGRPRAAMGPQPEAISGACLWVLPNPSGLNAHYQMPALTGLFAALKEAGNLGRS